MNRLIAGVACLTLLAGCAPFKPVGIGAPDSLAFSRDGIGYGERRDPVEAMTSPTEDGLGVALSGGGLRSSLYVFGVLKALYDAEILDEAAFLSSVSGGGYIAYSLYTDLVAHPEQSRFGEGLFSQSAFPTQACELATSGNFVTNWQYAGTLVSGVFRGGLHKPAVELYEDAIARTYSRGEGGPALTLADLPHGDSVDYAFRVPYPIINAALQGCNSDDQTCSLRHFNDAGFEFTPDRLGTATVGYAPIADAVPLLRAVAISGAAFARLGKRKLLEQSISWPNCESQGGRTADVCPATVQVSDGGHIENLGVMALIRRNVKRIVVIDAEYNKDYGFEGYVTLKKRLRAFGYALSVDDIDDWLASPRAGHPARAVYTGKVTRDADGSPEVAIYYVKMSLPESISDRGPANSWAAEMREFNAYLAAISDSKTARSDNRFDCSALQGYWDGDDGKARMRGALQYIVLSQSECQNSRNPFKCGIKFTLSKLKPGSFRFPHFSTADQSFYQDQSLAYIGLGYLQGGGGC